jgi:phospholipid-binding lipoprotein MlaA
MDKASKFFYSSPSPQPSPIKGEGVFLTFYEIINLNRSKKAREKGVRTMKRLLFPIAVLALLTAACAHRPSSISSLAPPAESFELRLVMVDSGSQQIPLRPPELSAASGEASERPDSSVKSGKESAEPKEDLQGEETEGVGKAVEIADPLEPFNRAMFQFNDKLYFWALKPVAQGYNKVVPEGARVSVKNFFSNLRFPIRFVSCLFRADFNCAATEVGRFTVNTIWGVGGLLDPASSKQLDIPKREADLGQTLGVYGLGQGFYFVWPVLGPSSLRDSVGFVGDFFLYPVSYIRPWYAWLPVRAYEEVNSASLKIGDYEFLKDAAIDPYLALRDAYAQYRQKVIEAAKGNQIPLKPGGVR